MVQADLIIPPIIVGLLIILIFRVNAFIMETSVDTRLNNDVQMYAETAATVLQEELRKISGNLSLESDTLRFDNTDHGRTRITRNQRSLEIIHENPLPADPDSLHPDTLIFPLHLIDLQFTFEPQNVSYPDFIRIRVETESHPGQHVRFRNEEQTVRAFAERRLLMRNVVVDRIQ